MAASLDGFIARRNGDVDWLETTDTFDAGETLSAEVAAQFLETIDCYVMGARTYETAAAFEAKGLGWPYGDTPTVVLTHRTLPRTRPSIEFCAGDLAQVIEEQLKPRFRHIWVVGGGIVAAECLRRRLADEVRYSIVPMVIGRGISFFEGFEGDVALHLVEVKAYRNGIVGLRYDVRKQTP